MKKSKFEKLIEHILNNNDDQARELFHEIVLEKSREIYNDIVAEDESVDEYGIEDASDDFENDIDADEEGLDVDGNDEEMELSQDDISFDDDDMDMDSSEDDMDLDMDMDSSEDDMDMDMDMDSSEDDMEDRVVDLESALDELKAEFDKLMGQEEAEHADMEDEDDVMPENVVREYTEKAPAPVKTETNVNSKSVVAGKNDMGGTAKNLNQGGSNANPTGPSKPNNAYTKGQGEFGVADPKAAAKGAFKSKAPSAKTGEVGGTNSKSPLAK